MNEMIVFDKDEVLEMVAAHLIKKRLIKAGIHSKPLIFKGVTWTDTQGVGGW